MADRAFDIVLFGATGFTGTLTAEYFAAHAPAGTRWALAGRDEHRLRALRDRLGVDVEVLAADASDPRSLRVLAEGSRVVATTVGPYIRYGQPLVAACAAAGTDYVDLTGEPEFADRTYLAHHTTAQRTGARLVHACGFDSIRPIWARCSPSSSCRPAGRSGCAATSAPAACRPAARSTLS